MCGIAGFIDLRFASKPEALRDQAAAMGNAIRHRGPDGDGIFIDEEAGLAFAHRRLAIVDLTPAGAQPMVSASGRFVICYNGEIYNSEDMRRDPALTAVAWRGHSDTEVILEYAAAHGIERMLQQANGMFAIAVWDRRDRVLYLARDRMGIKPLFAAQLPRGIAFASELKAIRQVAGFAAEIDSCAVANFLRLAYVPAPGCIYRDVRKLMPGTFERFDVEHIESARVPQQTRRYWSLRDVAEAGLRDPLRLDDVAATDLLADLLSEAVKRQLMSDVPLGALLSGGIDSSAIVAMMTETSSQTVRTFSIGFESAEFDESRHAAAVAKHLGTAHTELRVTPEDALDVIPRLGDIYDEPFADSSQIPTYLVSRLTREHVTVALSGDGGDELFAGYNRHKFAAGAGVGLQRVPRWARTLAGAALAAAPSGGLAVASAMLPTRYRAAQAADKARKLARILRLEPSGIYDSLVSKVESLDDIAPALAKYTRVRDADVPAFPQLLEEMQYRDMQGYLPDDILQKVDRASMAAALEVRPPFLDHRLVEFAWRLPSAQKIRGGETKWLLRRVLQRKVPRNLIDRPKMGFAVPLAEWLRGPLSEWACDVLSSSGRWSELLSREGVWALWQRHQSGRENLAHALWPVLMLACWDLQARR